MEINIPEDVHDFTLINSNVDKLTRLSLVLSPGSSQISIENSTIRNTTRFKVSGLDIRISNSFFEEVNPLSMHLGGKIFMQNVTFGHVKRHGIIVSSMYPFQTKNLHFQKVDRHGILLDKDVTWNNLNITINNCETPCIVGSKIDSSILVDTKIDFSDDRSPVYTYKHGFPFNLERVVLDEKHKGCRKTISSYGFALDCDLRKDSRVSALTAKENRTNCL